MVGFEGFWLFIYFDWNKIIAARNLNASCIQETFKEMH